MNNINDPRRRPQRPADSRSLSNSPPQNRPAQPRANRQSGAPRLSPIEIERRRAAALKREEARRRAAAREAAIRKKIKEENKRRRIAAAKLFFYRFIVYLVVLAIMFSLFALVFFTGLKKTDKIKENDFVYYLADEKKVKLPYSSVMRGGSMYVNFTRIAQKFGVTLTGSYDEMRFVLGESGEFVRFVPNDLIAEVNGGRIRLGAPPILEGENLYVPVAFIERYMDGISVKYDESAHSLTVKRVSYGAEDKVISFYQKRAVPSAHIAESEDIGEIKDTNE